MNRRRPLLISISFLFVSFLSAAFPGAFADTTYSQDEVQSKAEIDFNSQIRPLLQKHCAGCHNDDELDGEFSLESFEGLLAGGDSGEAIVPGESRNSLLIQMMTGEVTPAMPPEDQPQLTDEEIQLIASWIDEGASGPGTELMPSIEFPKLQRSAADTPVTSADWSGNRIANSRFGVLQLRGQEKSDLSHVLDGFPGKVNSVRFSSDAKRIIVASGVAGVSGEATIWDAETLELIMRIEGHGDVLYHAIESPDGRMIATAGYDRRIILTDIQSGKIVHEMTGHNDAIYDLDFSPDSKTLISASGDQTIKVWDVATGRRLDTLGQPLEEQFAARFSPDGKFIAGGGRDNRIRIWKFESNGEVKTNPLLFSRFAHEGPIVALVYSRDGTRLVSASEDKTIKVWETETMRQTATINNQPDVCAALAIAPDGNRIFVGRLDGSVEILELPEPVAAPVISQGDTGATSNHGERDSEPAKIAEAEPNDSADDAQLISWPAVVSGTIGGVSDKVDFDSFAFKANRGEAVMLEIHASRNESPLDSKIEVLNVKGDPVERVVLRAVRDSYFTFRGKDSANSDDFRVHNWEEMGLNDFLYCNGEVVRLFLHPRGPDSGFKVYPGYGSRYAWFDTTPLSHPLHEPCYVVRPYPVGTEFQPNGLPVFKLNFENDDDPLRKHGSDSRLTFVPPTDGTFVARISDVRGFGGEEFKYEFHVRAPQPTFSVKFNHKKDLRKGGGQEFSVTADRVDGFNDSIAVEIGNVPASLSITSPLVIESGHNRAFGTIHIAADADAPTKEELEAIVIQATGGTGDKVIKKEVNGFDQVTFHDQPKIQLRIVATDTAVESAFDNPVDSSNGVDEAIFDVIAGENLELKVVAKRIDHETRISFGNEDSGRNLPHGVYVDDIGLNGLMLTKGKTEQSFFIKAEAWVQPTIRTFHVRANDVDGEASIPVKIRVVAPRSGDSADLPLQKE